MRLIIGITLVSLILASECPKFTCGKTSLKDKFISPDVCLAQVEEGYEFRDVCKEGYLCGSVGGTWYNIDGETKSSDQLQMKCMKGSEFSVMENKTGIPEGDVCRIGNHSGKCSMNTDCPESGVCNSGLQEDDENCNNRMNSCMTGLYCKNNKCTKELSLGEVCAKNMDGCPFGASCVSVNNEEATCTPWFSVPNGKSVHVVYGDFTPTHFCESWYVIKNEENFHDICMPPPITVEDTSKPQTSCHVRHFNNPANMSAYQETAEQSKCGFNQDGQKYCTAQIGDPLVQNKMNKIRVVAKLFVGKCNHDSGSDFLNFSDYSCGLIADVIKDNKMEWFMNQIGDLDATPGSANFANNADCLKHTILSSYYGFENKEDKIGESQI